VVIRGVTIPMLREQRASRRLLRSIYNGQWRGVLLGLQQSQHRFPAMRNFAGKIGELLVKFNVVALAIDWHATVLAQQPAETVTPEGFDDQQAAIASIRARSLFDALLMEAAEVLNVEGYATFVPEITERGVVLALADNERMFPWGGFGADGQPVEWRQRWVIERTDGQRKRLYLREVRYAAGTIQNLAYKTDSSDVLVEDKDLEPVTLAEALGAELAAVTPELIQTGIEFPLPVLLTGGRAGGVPRPIIGPESIDLIDASAAALSRMSRALDMHGQPKWRVPPSSIDPKTGKVDLSAEAVEDPQKQFEAIAVEMDFGAMLEFTDRAVELLMTELKLSKSLAGIKPGGGNTAISAESMRLESKATLAHGRKTAVYCQPALSRVFTAASLMEAMLPPQPGRLRGFAVAPVAVKLKPDIPRDREDIIAEQAEMLERGLTSQWRAIAAIHGEDQADAVVDEINTQREREAELARRAIGVEMGFTGAAAGAGIGGAAAGNEGGGSDGD
jgi:hypothetical protein